MILRQAQDKRKGKPIRKTQGKFIVFEGADGSGKSTQAKLFFEFLKRQKIPAVLTSFPRYESAWGKMIRRYLNGEFGGINEVGPYVASMLYVGDRLLAKDEIKKWLNEGKTVVCDRYVASNIAHQSAKLKTPKAKLQFIKWVEELEYKENKIPKPDLVILMTIPSSVAQKFMARRVRDIHEVDTKYQEAVAKAFEDYAKGKTNWITVSNMRGNKLRSIEVVNKEIVTKLKQGLTL